MPKTPSTQLHELIHSMSRAEKRYFKLYSGSSGSKYEQLFDTIHKQKEFDDEACIEAIYQDEEITSRKYSELKHYLFDLILKSIIRYDENSSVDNKLQTLIASIECLFKRGHYSSCRQLITKAKKTAFDFEKHQIVLYLIRKEKEIAFVEGEIEMLEAHLENLEREELEMIDRIGQETQYQNTFFRLFTRVRKEALLRSERKREIFDKFIHDQMPGKISEAKTLRAKILHHRIYQLYFYATLQFEKLYSESIKLLQLLEDDPRWKKEELSDYLAGLSNFIFCCGVLERYDEVWSYLERLRDLEPDTYHNRLRQHTEYYSNLFSYYIFKGQFKEAKSHLKTHQLALKSMGGPASVSNRFHFQYFYIHFGCGEYDEALDHLNAWLSLPRSVGREDMQSLARILNLMIHYEKDNHMLLDSLIRSSYRYLQSRDRVFEFEKAMIHTIRQVNQEASKQRKRDLFRQLKVKFKELEQVPEQKVMFQYFDFISWVESKIQHASFDQIVAAKKQSSAKS